MPASNTYESISSVTLTSNSTTVTFGSIPQTYTDLVLVIVAKITSGGLDMFIRFNSDTGSNYSYTQLYGNGTSAASARGSSQTVGIAGSVYASNDGVAINHIMNYSNTTTNKSWLTRFSRGDGSAQIFANLWRSTSAISSFELSSGNPAGTFTSGSTFSLYGIKAA